MKEVKKLTLKYIHTEKCEKKKKKRDKDQCYSWEKDFSFRKEKNEIFKISRKVNTNKER